MISICETGPQHVDQLEELQKLVFPTLSYESLFRKEHYLNHIRIFPQGQFIALENEKVVGMTTTILLDLDPDNSHSFLDILDHGYLNTHDPNAEWLYGLDIGTHPDYRGRGIARKLYDARQSLVKRLHLKGQYTYGMLTGYGALKGQLSAEQYYQQLLDGKRTDPTVSRQISNGFKPTKLVAGYVEDPVCDGYCVLLIRENQDL